MCCFRLGTPRSALRLLCLNRLKYINRDSQYCVSVLCAAEQKGCKPTIISNCTKTIRRMLSKFAIEWSCRCVHGYRVTEDERQITNWYELNDNQTRKGNIFSISFSDYRAMTDRNDLINYCHSGSIWAAPAVAVAEAEDENKSFMCRNESRFIRGSWVAHCLCEEIGKIRY